MNVLTEHMISTTHLPWGSAAGSAFLKEKKTFESDLINNSLTKIMTVGIVQNLRGEVVEHVYYKTLLVTRCKSDWKLNETKIK